MPKRAILALAVTTVALVLLLSFKTPDDGVPIRGGGTVAADAGATPGATARPRATVRPGAAAVPGATPTPAATSGTGGDTGAATTVDGPVVDTRYGPVQVEISIAAGRIEDIVALQLPTGRRSGQISHVAEPILHQEALAAQNASIDIVSGATYTSDAYAQSLQAALDQAGLR